MTHRSKMTNVTNGTVNNTSTIVHPQDAHIQAALEIHPRYVDKNIHETLERINAYDIH